MSAKINKINLFLFYFEEKNVGGPVKQVKRVSPKHKVKCIIKHYVASEGEAFYD